jgi:hypothetical protein
MLALELEPVQIDPSEASTRQAAYSALTYAAQRYLCELDRLCTVGDVPATAAAITPSTRHRSWGCLRQLARAARR